MRKAMVGIAKSNLRFGWNKLEVNRVLQKDHASATDGTGAEQYQPRAKNGGDLNTVVLLQFTQTTDESLARRTDIFPASLNNYQHSCYSLSLMRLKQLSDTLCLPNP